MGARGAGKPPSKFSFKQNFIIAELLSKTKDQDGNFGFGRNFVTKIGQKGRVVGA